MSSTLKKLGRRLLGRALGRGPRGILPEGDYYTLLWGIPESFGGMTTVSLDRTSAFARQDNRPVTILTFAPHGSGRAREAEFKAEGRLDKRVSIRNLWDDLRSWSDDELRRMKGTAKIDESALDDALPRSDDNWRETRADETGTELQVDSYDRQGRLLVIDRKDCGERGTKGGRRLTLVDSKKQIIGQWRTATAFYKAWLDAVFGNNPSYVICDSAFAGNLFNSYRRKNVVFCQVIHSHFLKNAAVSSRELISSKFKLLHNLDRFDRAVTLTEAERSDMLSRNLSADNLVAVSNLTEDLHGELNSPRNENRGIMLARLTPAKRIEHAVEALSRASSAAPETIVDVYGKGKHSRAIQTAIDNAALNHRFTLRGFDADAKQQLLSSSFSLLASKQEGQALVLLESMSAGCIPIAYDIDYGPSDIITDGLDGFLVPAGDIDALADAIVKVATMDDADLREMRRNAINRAKDFYEDAIVRKWAKMFAECTFETIRPSKATAELASLAVTGSAVALEAVVDNHPWPHTEHAFISWRLAGKSYYGRAGAEFDGTTLRAEIPLEELRQLPVGELEISADFVDGRSFHRTRITADLDCVDLDDSRISASLDKKQQLVLRSPAD